MADIRPVILAGGSGTRLWPLSRDAYPKQLLALHGSATLLQQTARRLDGLGAVTPGEIEVLAPLVVSNEAYRFMVSEQLEETGRGASSVVLEPVGRNTAPALTASALLEQADGSDPVLLVMASDHRIQDPQAFCVAVAAGLPHAERGDVVTFGIVPERAETGYGYIQTDAPRAANGFVADVLRFVEKPDAPRAERYLASGDYLWNSGMFMVRASVWCAALGTLRPDILSACQASVDGGGRDGVFFRVEPAAFAACPSDSIDYAVMERLCPSDGERSDALPRAVVVALAAGWSDIGSFDALLEASDLDAAGNSAHGDVYLDDACNSLVIASGRLVVGIGLRDQIVVETPDAVLVADRSKSQEVRGAVSWLREHGRDEGRVHRRVHRPWGHVEQLDEGERFAVKRLTIRPGRGIALQRHHHRAEHWVVVRGTASVTRGDERFLLSENESTFIPLGVVHRLENPGKVALEVIEVRSGAYLGEDDIERVEEQGTGAAAAPHASLA